MDTGERIVSSGESGCLSVAFSVAEVCMPVCMYVLRYPVRISLGLPPYRYCERIIGTDGMGR